MLLGDEQFTEMLLSLGKDRNNTFEIGRWVADLAPGGQDGLAPGIGVQLAAASGALALALANQSADANGIAIFSAGSRDKQYLTLARLGLSTVPGIEPVISNEYDDVIRVMYCTKVQELQIRFQRMMDAMAQTIGLDQILFTEAEGVES